MPAHFMCWHSSVYKAGSCVYATIWEANAPKEKIRTRIANEMGYLHGNGITTMNFDKAINLKELYKFIQEIKYV